MRAHYDFPCTSGGMPARAQLLNDTLVMYATYGKTDYFFDLQPYVGRNAVEPSSLYGFTVTASPHMALCLQAQPNDSIGALVTEA